MSYPSSSSSQLVITARKAGYRELPVGRSKSTLHSVCPECKKKRMIRFHKVKKVKGPKVVDRCYGCGHYVEVTKPRKAKAASA